ncbi:hypothetical protein COW46_01110 [Candidatus Gracilibacteria bacterium CG17_big_fil_post_rev_8_21_14_2_50_48_13]|nr:MAG: hypothetical protein COW46_01110 [Candidatus Gracilibacteria bacterium CG17_big_fil_post_rev_8_21_14_2_50_48_13]
MAFSFRHSALCGSLLLSAITACSPSNGDADFQRRKEHESTIHKRERLVHNARVLIKKTQLPMRNELLKLLGQTASVEVTHHQGKLFVKFLEQNLRGRMEHLLGVAFVTSEQMELLPLGHQSMAQYSPTLHTMIMREVTNVSEEWEAVSFTHELLHAERTLSKHAAVDHCEEEAAVREIEGQLLRALSSEEYPDLVEQMTSYAAPEDIAYPDFDRVFGRPFSEEERVLRDSMIHIQVLFAKERQRKTSKVPVSARLAKVYCDVEQAMIKESTRHRAK